MTYILPQVQVFQEFGQLPNDVVQNLNAFVFGPNYQLFRYAESSEKELIGLGAYDYTVDQTYAYPNLPQGSSVDLQYVKVIMENVWAEYALIGASESTQLVSVSNTQRNKLRAVPRVQTTSYLDTNGDEAQGAYEDDGVSTIELSNGIGVKPGGYVYDSPSIPENFYFFPQGGNVANSWAHVGVTDATLEFVSFSEGQVGTVDIPATDSPLLSGVTFQGPYGLVLDLDAGTRTMASFDYSAGNLTNEVMTVEATNYTAAGNLAVGADAAETAENLKALIDADIIAGTFAEDIREVVIDKANEKIYVIGTGTITLASGGVWTATASSAFEAIRKPVQLKVNGANGSYFLIDVDPNALPNLIDESIDTQKSLKFQWNSGEAVANPPTWSNVENRVVINFDGVTNTLLALRTLIVANSDIAAVLDVGAIQGTDSELVASITDETTAPVTEALDVFMLPDVYRVRVLDNEITWKTGNGFNRSAIFKTRDVQVGDRVRYSVVGADSQTYTGTTKIAAIETDTLAAFIEDPAVEPANAPSQSGQQLLPHTGANDIFTPGADNQRGFNGAKTALYALSTDPFSYYYPGDYSNGIISETFSVLITAGGAAGVARATVSTESGNYTRLNVPVTQIHFDDADENDMAMISLGQNLWAVLHKSAGDADAEFQVGDVYSFAYAIEAPWEAISATQLSKTGTYSGPADTTYVLEVTRGGVFDRNVQVTDGLFTPNELTLTYTGQPTAAQTIEIGGAVFEFGGAVTPPNIQVAIGGNAEATYTELVTQINASVAPVYASLTPGIDTSNGTVLLRSSSTVIAAANAAGVDNMTATAETAELSSNLDFDANEWLAGDIDDEYVIRCTASGTLTTAQFTVFSQRGDNVSVLSFPGDGIGNTTNVGSNGLSVYWTLSAPNITFNVGDEWVTKVNATRPQVTIVDTSGIDQSTVEVVNDGDVIDLGLYGAQVTFSSNNNSELDPAGVGGLLKGDIYYVVCRAASSGAFRTLVLADDLPEQATTGLTVDDSGAIPVANANFDPSEFSIWLYLVQAWNEISGRKLQSPPDFNWTADASGLTVNQDIEVQDASWTELNGDLPYLPVYAGDLFVEYRALMLTYSDTVYSLNTIADVVNTLGTVDPDNPLAQGVFNALSNSGDQPVFFMGVPSNDLAGYSNVLDKAEKTDQIYGLAPLTTDAQTLVALEGHINTMSAAEEKKWRIGFVGADLPALAVVYDTTNHPTGGVYQATITDDPGVTGLQFTIVEFNLSGETQALDDIAVGDSLRVNFATDAWGTATYQEYEIAEVVSNTKVKLVTGPGAPINTATKVEVWHTNSTAETATAVAALSTGFANRRIYHVFPDKLYLDGVAQSSVFAAASLVGLVSSVAPQQGLTNIELNGFDDVPATYATYTRTQLNEMAGAGTFIIMQDYAGGRIYVRHQLSTAASEGNLNTSELSITKNLDAISYFFVGVLSPYIGRFNVSPELLDQLFVEVNSGLNFLSSSYTGAGLLGPMVVADTGSTIRTLEQHPTLRDHVIIIVDLVLPAPLNVIQLRLVV